jgi:hypothetical protein
MDGRQEQFARAMARRRFERAAELDEAETLQPQVELAPGGGLDWPPIVMLSLVLVVVVGCGYIVLHG